VLADYGFITIRLSSDWRGADFIAQHFDGMTFLPVQLKGALMFDKRYVGRGLHICFRHERAWFIYPHDDLLRQVEASFCETQSWCTEGTYHFPHIPKQLLKLLEPFRLEG